jgi:hypothetical protein
MSAVRDSSGSQKRNQTQHHWTSDRDELCITGLSLEPFTLTSDDRNIRFPTRLMYVPASLLSNLIV